MLLWNIKRQKLERYKWIRCRICNENMASTGIKFYAGYPKQNTCYDCYVKFIAKQIEAEKEANGKTLT